jgi:hypothetical protein
MNHLYKTITLVVGSLILNSSFSVAAEEVDDGSAKLREALRNVTMQLRTTQTEAATAKASQGQAEMKNAELTKQLDALTKQIVIDQSKAKKDIETLELKNDESDKKIAALEVALAKWKEGYNKAAQLAMTKDKQCLQLADEKSVANAKLRDARYKNLQLFTTANEILKRYEGFSLGQAIKAREPFTGITRARLESFVEEYRDKVNDQRLKKVDVIAVKQQAPKKKKN